MGTFNVAERPQNKSARVITFVMAVVNPHPFTSLTFVLF